MPDTTTSRGPPGQSKMDLNVDVPSHRKETMTRRNSSSFLKPVLLLFLVFIVYVTRTFLPPSFSDMLPLRTSRWGSLSIEERATKILNENPLIDGHNDLAILVRTVFANKVYASNFTKPFEHGGMPQHVDLPRLDAGQVGGAFWSAFMICQKDIFDFSDEAYLPVVQATLAQIDLYHRLGAQYPHYFTQPPTAAAALHAWQHSGTLVSPLAIEGLHQIGNSLSTLRLYHALGVRYATLTWNCHNAYADAAVLTFLHNGSSVAAPPHWHGLSAPGRAVVREMNRLGMLVDISHVSTATMRDVLVGEHRGDAAANPSTIPAPDAAHDWTGSLAPPIFSHSSARALCPHPRNVPDDVLQLVRRRGGLVMVNFAPDFISCTAPPRGAPEGALPDLYAPNATLAQVVRHIRHIGELIGYEHVGLGSDFDGIEKAPEGLEDVAAFPRLVEELLRQGVSDADVAKVVGRNLLRVWEEADRVSREMKKKGWLPAEDELKLPEVDASS